MTTHNTATKGMFLSDEFILITTKLPWLFLRIHFQWRHLGWLACRTRNDFDHNFFNQNWHKLIWISLKFVFRCLIDNKLILVQVIDWGRMDAPHYGNRLLPHSLTHVCVIRSQWFKSELGTLSVPRSATISDKSVLSIGINVRKSSHHTPKEPKKTCITFYEAFWIALIHVDSNDLVHTMSSIIGFDKRTDPALKPPLLLHAYHMLLWTRKTLRENEAPCK